MKKAAIGVFLCVFLANLAGAQSVAELARAQKARRAALKGKPAVVITNKDLAKVKRTPALVVQTPLEITAENIEAATVAETPPEGEGTPTAAESTPPPAAPAPSETGVLTEPAVQGKTGRALGRRGAGSGIRRPAPAEARPALAAVLQLG